MIIIKITISSIVIGLKELLFPTNSHVKLLSDNLLSDSLLSDSLLPDSLLKRSTQKRNNFAAREKENARTKHSHTPKQTKKFSGEKGFNLETTMASR